MKRKKKTLQNDITENGFNYRISDINCALAISQLERIEHFLNSEKKFTNAI